MKAPEILTRSAEIMAERAKQYDSPQGERSMGKAVAAFNAVTGQSLSEANGWLLMALLKMVRDNTTTEPHADSINDLVAYGALYGEARLASMNQPESDWIDWGGGDCPVEFDVIVEYKLRSDCRYTRVARYLCWYHEGGESDIIAYRIVK